METETWTIELFNVDTQDLLCGNTSITDQSKLVGVKGTNKDFDSF